MLEATQQFCRKKLGVGGLPGGGCPIGEAVDNMNAEFKLLKNANTNLAQRKSIANKLMNVLKTSKNAKTAMAVLGPYGLFGEALIEAAFVGNSVLGGTPFKEAWAETLWSYLDPGMYKNGSKIKADDFKSEALLLNGASYGAIQSLYTNSKGKEAEELKSRAKNLESNFLSNPEDSLIASNDLSAIIEEGKIQSENYRLMSQTGLDEASQEELKNQQDSLFDKRKAKQTVVIGKMSISSKNRINENPGNTYRDKARDAIQIRARENVMPQDYKAAGDPRLSKEIIKKYGESLGHNPTEEQINVFREKTRYPGMMKMSGMKGHQDSFFKGKYIPNKTTIDKFKEQGLDVSKFRPVYDFAQGGIASLTKTVAPKKGPQSQGQSEGLAYFMKHGKK